MQCSHGRAFVLRQLLRESTHYLASTSTTNADQMDCNKHQCVCRCNWGVWSGGSRLVKSRWYWLCFVEDDCYISYWAAVMGFPCGKSICFVLPLFWFDIVCVITRDSNMPNHCHDLSLLFELASLHSSYFLSHRCSSVSRLYLRSMTRWNQVVQCIFSFW